MSDNIEQQLKACIENAQCQCTVAERDSGHLVGCWFPELREAFDAWNTRALSQPVAQEGVDPDNAFYMTQQVRIKGGTDIGVIQGLGKFHGEYLIGWPSGGSTRHDWETLEAAITPKAPEAKCWCEKCEQIERILTARNHMIVCPDCGYKRCPRATDHNNACTNSNEPGQHGSSHAKAPEAVEQSAPRDPMEAAAQYVDKHLPSLSQPAPVDEREAQWENPRYGEFVFADSQGKVLARIHKMYTSWKVWAGDESLGEYLTYAHAQSAASAALQARAALAEPGGMSAAIVRYNDDGTLDEVIADQCQFHIEQMDNGHWWIGVNAADKFYHINLYSKGHIKARIEDEPRHDKAGNVVDAPLTGKGKWNDLHKLMDIEPKHHDIFDCVRSMLEEAELACLREGREAALEEAAGVLTVDSDGLMRLSHEVDELPAGKYELRALKDKP